MELPRLISGGAGGYTYNWTQATQQVMEQK
jgi:hypothetical protein